jgi:hypothetical protein
MSRAHELRQAVQDCRSRALYASAKWAAAALCGLPEEELMGSAQAAAAADCGSGDSAYQLARSLFDLKVGHYTLHARTGWLCAKFTCYAHLQPCRRCGLHAARSPCFVQEYRSAAHVLRDSLDPLCLFLRGYAMYLAGEKRKE